MDWIALKAANAPINAFVDWDKSAVGSRGPLAGLTIGVKANIAVKGLPWTAGMALYRDRIAEHDAEAVMRLRNAGAAIIGTLNMDEAALGAKTDNPFFGTTQNPHRLGYTPGGSSGGGGAAVAAGLCDVALGSDTMGSVRIPASYCGVYGFKPANAAISQDGLELAEPSLDAIGLLARDLDTLEQVSRQVSDFGEGDNVGPYGSGTTLFDLGDVVCAPDVITVYEKAKAALGELQHVALALSSSRSAGFIATSKYLASAFAGADQAQLSPQLRKLLTYGPKRSAADWEEDQQILADTRDEILAMVGRYGFLLLPTAPQTAFPHSEAAPANQADFTCLANIAGLPSITLPAGWSADDLPIGIQLVGQIGHEAGLFDLAKALDKSLAAYRPPATFMST